MNDREINITEVKSYKEEFNRAGIKNISCLWSAFAQRLTQTTRTKEKFADYIKLPIDKKMAKKACCGGFVAGRLGDKKTRKADNVKSRDLITLDFDNGDIDILKQIKDFSLLGYAFCYYTTHSHSKDTPRYRIVIPLNEEIKGCEYQSISEYVASLVCKQEQVFDKKSFEVQQIMFYPTTSTDGIFESKVFNGDFISVAYIKSKLKNIIPIEIQERAKKESPLNKDGLIGTFCRTYTVSEAIEKFLPNIYERVSDKRYRLITSNSIAGLCIYSDDLFCYSNHETDKAFGKLCNAFDIVKIHKFGDLDKGIAEDTPEQERPGFKKMIELCLNDENVKKTSILEDFKDITKDLLKKNNDVIDTEQNINWILTLERDKKTKLIKSTIENYLTILNNDILLKGKLRFNSFTDKREVKGQLYWRKKNDFRDWTDTDNGALRLHFEKYYKILNKDKIKDALNMVFEENAYHPIKDYLNGLGKWDGIERIKNILPDFLGVEQNNYNYEVFKTSLIACIARIFEPGIKYDSVLILVGQQGIGKSLLLAKLVPNIDWFSDDFAIRGTKEDKEQLVGKWIIEIAELAGLKKAEIEDIKKYITSQSDCVRFAYKEEKETKKRQCVFFGTTNNDDFLKTRQEIDVFCLLIPILIREQKRFGKTLTMI